MFQLDASLAVRGLRSVAPFRLARTGRRGRRRFAAAVLMLACLGEATPIGARAQAAQVEGIEVTTLDVQRTEHGLVLDFAAKVWPNRTVDEALLRGIPVYFVAEATVYRPRWWWRDERINRSTRTWRVSYQPLTSTWRVGTGGLSQTVASQAEALALVGRLPGWKIAEASRIAADERYYVDFSYRLDTSQLPRPMQLSGGALNEWSLEFERSLRVD